MQQNNLIEAETWLLRAAEMNDSEAQLLLGMLYFQGVTGTPDFEKAKQWLQRAADNGNENARTILEQLAQAAAASLQQPF